MSEQPKESHELEDTLNGIEAQTADIALSHEEILKRARILKMRYDILDREVTDLERDANEALRVEGKTPDAALVLIRTLLTKVGAHLMDELEERLTGEDSNEYRQLLVSMDALITRANDQERALNTAVPNPALLDESGFQRYKPVATSVAYIVTSSHDIERSSRNLVERKRELKSRIAGVGFIAIEDEKTKK